MFRTIGVFAIVALAFAGFAFAAAQGDSYKVSANLKARSEVPRPKGVPAGATGSFTGTAVELANDKARVTWKLTFSRLSGSAIAAHIHIGKPGKAAAAPGKAGSEHRELSRGRSQVPESRPARRRSADCCA